MNLLDLAEEMGWSRVKHHPAAAGNTIAHVPDAEEMTDLCSGLKRGPLLVPPMQSKGRCHPVLQRFSKTVLSRLHTLKCRKIFQDLHFNPGIKPPDHPSPIQFHPARGQDKARAFIENSHQRLLIDKMAMELILKRGLSVDTIKKNQLGWNPFKMFHRRADWGLEETGRTPMGMPAPGNRHPYLRE